MLGNTRFHPVLVPVVETATGREYRSIVMKPRGADDQVPLNANTNFSCLLREVAVDNKNTGSVPFVLEETYVDSASTTGTNVVITTTVMVRKVP
jgi:hypothetical protein